MKHSVYTAHVGSWLHRHRDSFIYVYVYIHTYVYVHMYTLSLADTYADPHVYRVTRKWYWSRRESHSINTPRCLLRPHPQERRCTPSTPPLSLLFLSLSLSLPFSSLSTRLPLYNVADVFAHSREKDDTVETGFRPAEDSGRKYFAQQKIF